MHRKNICLTGGIGSGKTTITNLLLDCKELCILDYDTFSRNLFEKDSPVYSKIIDFFESRGGSESEILNPDGSINRKFIGDAVFSNPDYLDKITRLELSYIIDRAKDVIRKERDGSDIKYFVHVIPAYFEYKSKIDGQINFVSVINIEAEDSVRRERLSNRNYSGGRLEGIFESQCDNEYRRRMSTVTFENNSDNPEIAAAKIRDYINTI